MVVKLSILPIAALLLLLFILISPDAHGTVSLRMLFLSGRRPLLPQLALMPIWLKQSSSARKICNSLVEILCSRPRLQKNNLCSASSLMVLFQMTNRAQTAPDPQDDDMFQHILQRLDHLEHRMVAPLENMMSKMSFDMTSRITFCKDRLHLLEDRVEQHDKAIKRIDGSSAAPVPLTAQALSPGKFSPTLPETIVAYTNVTELPRAAEPERKDLPESLAATAPSQHGSLERNTRGVDGSEEFYDLLGTPRRTPPGTPRPEDPQEPLWGKSFLRHGVHKLASKLEHLERDVAHLQDTDGTIIQMMGDCNNVQGDLHKKFDDLEAKIDSYIIDAPENKAKIDHMCDEIHNFVTGAKDLGQRVQKLEQAPAAPAPWTAPVPSAHAMGRPMAPTFGRQAEKFCGWNPAPCSHQDCGKQCHPPPRVPESLGGGAPLHGSPGRTARFEISTPDNSM